MPQLYLRIVVFHLPLSSGLLGLWVELLETGIQHPRGSVRLSRIAQMRPTANCDL